MHTLLVAASGLALIGLILGLASDRAGAAQRFIPIWAVVCLLHLGYAVGVYHLDLLGQFARHVLIFGLPAGLGFWFIRSARRKG